MQEFVDVDRLLVPQNRSREVLAELLAQSSDQDYLLGAVQVVTPELQGVLELSVSDLKVWRIGELIRVDNESKNRLRRNVGDIQRLGRLWRQRGAFEINGRRFAGIGIFRLLSHPVKPQVQAATIDTTMPKNAIETNFARKSHLRRNRPKPLIMNEAAAWAIAVSYATAPVARQIHTPVLLPGEVPPTLR